MRAVLLDRHGGPKQLGSVTDVPVPRPGPSEVLIAVRACGVCFFDVICRQGLRSRTKMPVILGHEIAGEVVELGAGVGRLRVGDRVVCSGGARCGECDACLAERGWPCERIVGIGSSIDGGYAEYVKLPARCLCPIPDGLSDEAAAIVSCAVQTPYSALVRKAGLRPGETVLVTGASGGVGIHAVQIARLVGARVIAVTSSAEKESALAAAGADTVVVARDGDFHEQVKAETGGAGVDVALETVASRTFDSSFRSLGRGGRLVFVGELTGERIGFNPAWAIYKELTLSGALTTGQGELRTVLGLAAAGKIRPVVFRRVGLHQVADAHATLERRGTIGRIVIVPTLAA